MKRKDFIQQLGVVSLGKLVIPNSVLANTSSANPAGSVMDKPSLDGLKLFDVNHSALLARAAISYGRPPYSENEGIPIGNGNMGTLVWTKPAKSATATTPAEPADPAKIMFQINRNDTFGQDRTHQHYDDAVLPGDKQEVTDNTLSLCRLGIHVGNATFQTLHQNTEEGVVTINYQANTGTVDFTTYVSAEHDMLIARIGDRRTTPEEINFEVSMVRQPHEEHGQSVWDYTITEQWGRIIIVQTVTEGSFYMQYAVAISVRGTPVVMVEKMPDRVKFKTKPFAGGFGFFLATATTLYERVDVRQKALAVLAIGEGQGTDTLLKQHRAWWRNFWVKSRTFMHLSSDDGVADFLEARYNLHLYHMGSSSRGKYPPLYNYGLWLATPDGYRYWGAQYKFMNDMMMYLPLYAANYMELTDSYLGMYRRMLPDCETAAKQRWGVTKGAFIPESLGFSGPTILSPQAAPMIHDVLMGRRTRASLPPEVVKECLVEATLDWINPKFKSVRFDQFTWVAHILTSGSQLAMQYYWRYQLTGDINWLRDSAYPMMKGMVDFYQSYAQKGADGLYHIIRSNVHESYWGVNDGIVDLAAIRSLTPKVIACSQTLGVDADRRAGWAEFVQKLAPYPAGDHPDVVRLQSPPAGVGGSPIPLFPAGTFGAGYAVKCVGRDNVDPVWVWPVHPFEAISLVKGRYTGCPEDKDNFQKMLLTYENVPPTWYGYMWPQYPGRLGLTDEVRKILPLYATGAGVSGLQNTWGQANNGLLPEAIQSALLQSIDNIIIVAPAWPAEWRASFTLLARGGFLVSATVNQGKPQVIQVESTFGTICRMVNPWFPAPAYLRRTGTTQQTLNGEIIEFPLVTGESVLLTGDEQMSLQLPIKINPVPGAVIKKIQAMHPDGKLRKTQLGKEGPGLPSGAPNKLMS